MPKISNAALVKGFCLVANPSNPIYFLMQMV
jgi:hypothetical protein